MALKTTRYLIILAFIIFAFCSTIESKRGGGRRGGSSRGSSSVWGRTKQTHTAPVNYDLYGSGQKKSKSQQTPPQPDHKASAPPAPPDQKPSSGDSSATFLQQERKQQLSPQNGQQRPIGWDVNQGNNMEGSINKNTAWNVGSSNQRNNLPPPPPYSAPTNLGNQPFHSGFYPNTGAGSYYGTGNNYNYGSAYPQQPYSFNQQPGHYSSSNFGGLPPRGYDNAYHGNMNGYHHGGGLTSMFNGNGYGSYGYGSGGLTKFGGYGGVGGYGKKFGGGFGKGFGKSAFRNVIIGLLVWNLVSGLTQRPYYVYNYYNNPEKVPKEMPIPITTVIVCPKNVTTLCAPNTDPLCTSNGMIFCVVLELQTVPCENDSTMRCVKSTATCDDDAEKECNNSKTTTDAIQIPCVTNAKMVSKETDATRGPTDGISFCVTTLAQPQPEEEAKKNMELPCKSNGTENASVVCKENEATEATKDVTTTPSNLKNADNKGDM